MASYRPTAFIFDRENVHRAVSSIHDVEKCLTDFLLLDIHSCQVYKRRDRDRVEIRINAREARAKIYGPRPLWWRPHLFSGHYVLPRPLNIEIYGLKFDNILSLCLCHTSICANRAGFRDNAAKSGKPGHRAKPGHLATMDITR